MDWFVRAIWVAIGVGVSIMLPGGSVASAEDASPNLQQWWWFSSDGSPAGERLYAQHIRMLGKMGADAVTIHLGGYQSNPAARKRVLARLAVIREAGIPNLIIFDTIVGYGNGPEQARVIRGLHVTDEGYPEAEAQYVADAEKFLDQYLPGVKRVYWLEDEAKAGPVVKQPAKPWQARQGQVPFVDLCVNMAKAIKKKSPKCVLGANGYPWEALRKYVKVWGIPHDYQIDSIASQMKADGFTVLGYWNRITLNTDGAPPDMARFRQWLRSAGCEGGLFYKWDDAAVAAWAAAAKDEQ